MVGISLVDEPAIMSDWQFFAKEDEKPQFIALKDEAGEYKQEILGAALRPDLAILRKDEAGNFYYGVFEADTIEIIRNKFHKQKNTSEVNLMHDSELKVDAYLNESYIIQNEEQLTATKSLGLEDIEVGSWIVRYKIESEEVFNEVIKNLNGFSIEILLERELMELHKNNFNKQNNSIMNKFNELLKRFKTVLSEFDEEVVEDAPTEETLEEDTPTTTLEDVTVAETDMVLRYTEVGSPVMEITTDEEGVETEVAAAEGEYILSDGRTLVVDADGNLSEIMDGDAETEPVAEETLTEETPAEETVAEETLAEEEGEKTDINKTLAELIPTDKDGSYQLEVYVSDGKFSFGTLYAYTYKDLKFNELVEQFEALKTEKEDLSTKVEELQAEIKKPIGAPVFTELKSEKNKKKEEFKSNLDYQLHRLGLEND